MRPEKIIKAAANALKITDHALHSTFPGKKPETNLRTLLIVDHVDMQSQNNNHTEKWN